MFPKDWSDQKIVDAVRDTIEDPDYFKPPIEGSPGRVVRKEVDGLVIEAKWRIIDGEAFFTTAYPSYGQGALRVAGDGTMVDIVPPKRKNKGFLPVGERR